MTALTVSPPSWACWLSASQPASSFRLVLTSPTHKWLSCATFGTNYWPAPTTEFGLEPITYVIDEEAYAVHLANIAAHKATRSGVVEVFESARIR
jgi:hypothetical protein